MKRMAWLAVVAALGCGASSGDVPGPSAGRPFLSGDACGVHEDQPSCAAAGCRFLLDTRPCVVGQPCPAGWCYAPGPSEPPPGIIAACGCEGAAGDVCVQQLGGPAVQADAPPNLSCRRGCQFLATASPADVCNCIARAPIERCWPSALVANLCDCDNGAR